MEESILQKIFIQDTVTNRTYYFKSIINSSPTKRMNITEYATTEGTSMTDYAFRDPVSINMNAKFSFLNNFDNAYYTDENGLPQYLTGEDVKKLFNSWFDEKTRLIMQTRSNTFENLLISELSVTETSSNLGVYDVSLTLKESRVAKIEAINSGSFLKKEDKVVNNTETNSGNNTGYEIATTLAGIGVGAAAGAAIGSIVPGIGTAAGAILGAGISFIGSLIGATKEGD